MEPPVMTSREITVPAWTFSALRDELGTISDKHSSTTLLQKVGTEVTEKILAGKYPR